MIGCVAAAAALNDGAGAGTAFRWCYLYCYGFRALTSAPRADVVSVPPGGIVSPMHFHVSDCGGSQRQHQRLITSLQLSTVFISPDDKHTHTGSDLELFAMTFEA